MNRLARLLLIAILALGAPPAALAHGRDAVPSDAARLEQYRTGLAAYLKRDYATALKQWRPLAERQKESAAAQLFLGFMYANGQGVAKDAGTAGDWYRRAAEQDHALAQMRLAFLYRRGEGVARDHIRAYLWAALAARQEGHTQKPARALLEALAAEMMPAQITEAKRLLAAWVESHGETE